MSFTLTVAFERVDCAHCAIPFAITKRYVDDRRDDHRAFYCPNGHSNGYHAKSDLELAREATTKAKLDAMEQRQRAIDAEHKLERAQKRACAGVCPKCKRSFVAVKRHMARMHPGAT